MRLATIGPFPFVNGLCGRYATVNVEDLKNTESRETALFDFLTHLGTGPQSFLCNDNLPLLTTTTGEDGNRYTVIGYTWVAWAAPENNTGLPPGIKYSNN